MEHLLSPTDKNEKQIKTQQIVQTKQKHVKTKKKFKSIGKERRFVGLA